MANEKRLIDANELTKKYCKEPAKGDCKNCDWYCDSWCSCEIFGVKIVDFPTVDAVEVVRCRDCKSYNGHRYCNYLAEAVLDDDFCSYGERRTDG